VSTPSTRRAGFSSAKEREILPPAQAANVKVFCDKAVAANLLVPGCPVTNIGF